MHGEELAGAQSEALVEDTPELMQLISAFDVARFDYIHACAGYRLNQSSEAMTEIGTYGGELIRSFRFSVKGICDVESKLELRAQLIANLMIGEDKARVEFFEVATGQKDYGSLSGGVVVPDESGDTKTSLVQSLYETILGVDTDEELVSQVTQRFVTIQQCDLDQYTAHIMESAEQSSTNRLYTVGRLLGIHALDVAKIGAGAALALWLSQRHRST